MNAPQQSRSITEINCFSQAILVNVCLSKPDLNQLGFIGPATCHMACLEDSEASKRLGDLLDLRYFETILLMQGMELEALEETVELWLANPIGEAVPGLLWALCTDSRPQAFALGDWLASEAMSLACRNLCHQGQCPKKSSWQND